jgi:hypothetical protein
MQLPAEHMYAAEMQSEFVVQLVLQALVPQMKGVQELVVGVWQVPVPLQVDAGWYVDVEQLWAMQVVPLAYLRQLPPPSQ